MLICKSLQLTAMFCFVLVSSVIMQACSGNSSSTTTTDSSGTQVAPMMADTTSQPDTSVMDTASTRPVKNPH